MSQQQPPTGQQSYQGQSMQQPPQSQQGGQSAQQGGGQTQQSGGQQFQQGAQQSGQQGGSPITEATFPTMNVLPQEVRSESVQSLNQILADATVLLTQCKTAHWNVKGPDFYQLHELFEDVAEMLEGYVDDIAERATALGGLAAGTVHAAAESSQLPTFPVTVTDERTLLESLGASLASFDATLQMQIQSASQRDDLDTADLLNELSRNVSKSLWFVEAHLQGEGLRQGGTGMQTGQGGQL